MANSVTTAFAAPPAVRLAQQRLASAVTAWKRAGETVQRCSDELGAAMAGKSTTGRGPAAGVTPAGRARGASNGHGRRKLATAGAN
jgi:hypothetical protein